MENQISMVAEDKIARGHFILDLSFLSHLRLFRNATAVLYVSEEVVTVFEKVQRSEYYGNVARALLRLWFPKRRDIDITAIGKELLFLLKRGIIRAIKEEDCDREILDDLRKRVRSRLWVELSPRKNLVAEIVAKTIGFAKKKGFPVIARSRQLIVRLRGKISIAELMLAGQGALDFKRRLKAGLFGQSSVSEIGAVLLIFFISELRPCLPWLYHGLTVVDPEVLMEEPDGG